MLKQRLQAQTNAKKRLVRLNPRANGAIKPVSCSRRMVSTIAPLPGKYQRIGCGELLRRTDQLCIRTHMLPSTDNGAQVSHPVVNDCEPGTWTGGGILHAKRITLDIPCADASRQNTRAAKACPADEGRRLVRPMRSIPLTRDTRSRTAPIGNGHGYKPRANGLNANGSSG